MNPEPKTELIIPAFNEEHRIAPTLRAYISFFANDIHFTVVLNGCTDNTLAAVHALQKEYPQRLRIIDIPAPIGKGAAIVQGWQESNAAVLGFVDADGATAPKEFQKLFDALEDSSGHDGAIASRFLAGAKILNRQSPIRTFMSYSFIALVKLFFRMPYRDTQCGAKLFRRGALMPLLPTLRETGMLFDVELLLKLYHNGASLVEVPTRWIDQPGSAALGSLRQFFAEGLHMLRGLLRLRLKK